MKELQGPEQGTADCNESDDSIVYTPISFLLQY